MSIISDSICEENYLDFVESLAISCAAKLDVMLLAAWSIRIFLWFEPLHFVL